MPLNITTLYAKWIPAQYKITWKVEGQSDRITSFEYGAYPVYGDENPTKTGYAFVGWRIEGSNEVRIYQVTGNATYTAWFLQNTDDIFVIHFDTNGGNYISPISVLRGKKITSYPKPVKAGYVFSGWYTETECINKWDENHEFSGDDPKEIILCAKWTKTAEKKSSGGGGGGGGGGAASTTTTKKAGGTFSKNWYSDNFGVWRIRNSGGQTVVNAWLCDDVIAANGQNVWYLLTADGAMIATGLVQDNTGNFYSLETEHNGYFGMLRYRDGYYNCNGQQVYLTFNRQHNGSFGAVTNADGLEKLKAIYGITTYGIGNENAVYTATF